MLRVIAKTFRIGQIHTALQKHKKFCNSSIIPLPYNLSHVCQYATRSKQTSFSEEDTLSYKVQQYLRTNTKCLVADIPGADQCSSNVCNDAYAVHQMLLVISHSLLPKANDVLKLFSLYSVSDHSILQDIISKKSLMMTVKRKIGESVSYMTRDELRHFAETLKEININTSKFLVKIAGFIDLECEKRAWVADIEQCLDLFDILLILYGNNIYRKKQYDMFMALFEKHINSLQPQHLVQVLHYVGIGKKKKISNDFVEKLVRKLDTCYQDLPFQDAGIAAAGIFKSNFKMNESSPFIHKTAHHLESKIRECFSLCDLESYGVVAMMKLIRAAKYRDSKVMSALNTFILHTDINTLSPQVVSHTLALYANSCIYQHEVFTKLEHTVIQHLRAPSQTVRLRDLSRVLWAFSHVNHQCNEDLFKIVDKSLMEFVYNGEVDIYPHFLSSTLFSMAILGHYPEELIKEVFRLKRIQRLQDYQKSKQLSRLLMLNECLKVEAPGLTAVIPNISKNNLPIRTLTDETHHRPSLAMLMKGAVFINQIVGVPVLKLKFPIIHINYASLVYDNSEMKYQDCLVLPDTTNRDHVLHQLNAIKEYSIKRPIAIELLDPHSTLSTSQPVGIVKMKIRLLTQCGWEVKKINSADVENCQGDVQALAALILDELTKEAV
nr:uncharacterized protein LOC123754124 [Procambarus clarkii]